MDGAVGSTEEGNHIGALGNPLGVELGVLCKSVGLADDAGKVASSGAPSPKDTPFPHGVVRPFRLPVGVGGPRPAAFSAVGVKGDGAEAPEGIFLAAVAGNHCAQAKPIGGICRGPELRRIAQQLAQIDGDPIAIIELAGLIHDDGLSGRQHLRRTSDDALPRAAGVKFRRVAIYTQRAAAHEDADTALGIYFGPVDV